MSFTKISIATNYYLISSFCKTCKFPKTPIEDDAKFVQELQNHKVLTVPGRGFGLNGYLRISYSVDDWVLEGSITGFKKAFNSFN